MKTPEFTHYVANYGYEPDPDYTKLNQLFKKKGIKQLSLNLYSTANSGCHTILARNFIQNPKLERTEKGYYSIIDSNDEKTIIADIVPDMILESVFKPYSSNMFESIVMLANNCYYDLMFYF